MAVPQQQPPTHQPYVVHHDFTGSAELTTTLAHAISDVTGIDVTDTEFTLNDYVDPDALDNLFKPKSDGTPRTNGSLNVTILGCQVVVHSNGQIVLTPPQQSRPNYQG
ncbi:MAG: HalOD1 output domain-containing protein [Halorientalis sp.]